MNDNSTEIVASGLAALERCHGGLTTDDWRAVRDAGALLERNPNAHPRTAREEWLIATGRRVAAWLGPAPENLGEDRPHE